MELMERRRILLDTPHINTITGSQFVTDMVAPLQSANVRIEPVQSGSGDPSPSNVRPILGSESVTLNVTGKNLFDKTSVTPSSMTCYTSSGDSVTRIGIEYHLPAGTYTLKCHSETVYTYVYMDVVDANRDFVSFASLSMSAAGGWTKVTVTLTDGQYLLIFKGTTTALSLDMDLQIEKGSTATTYEAYISSRYHIDWGKNLIGGLAFAEQVKNVMPAATLNTTAQTISFSGITTSNQPIEIVTGIFKPNTQYTFIHTGTTGNTKNIRWIYDDDSVDTANRPAASAYVSTAGKTVKALEKINNNAAPVTFQYMNCGVFEGVLEVDDFEPYVGEVYGGTVDFTTGVLTVNKRITSVSAIDYVLANYIKSDAVDGYININEIYPSKGASGYSLGELVADCLKFQNKSIWGVVGFPNCWTINGLQVHVNVANGLLGITDYTQETTTTAKTKLNAWLANNPVTVTIPIRPVTYQLTPQQILALKGINNLSMSGQVKFWTHRDIQ